MYVHVQICIIYIYIYIYILCAQSSHLYKPTHITLQLPALTATFLLAKQSLFHALECWLSNSLPLCVRSC
jgi:hypothetical protein